MRTLVVSLQRLYKKGSVTLDKIQSMKDSGTLTAEEFNYITEVVS